MNGTCAHCEDEITRREDGAWVSGEVTTLGDVFGAEGKAEFVYPPDPHCYWSANGKHEPLLYGEGGERLIWSHLGLLPLPGETGEEASA